MIRPGPNYARELKTQLYLLLRLSLPSTQIYHDEMGAFRNALKNRGTQLKSTLLRFSVNETDVKYRAFWKQ